MCHSVGSGSEECIGWRALLEVSSNRARKERGGNYIQIATVDANGLPRCRTVVFRGFLEQDSSGRSAMKMITNAQSDKVQQVRPNLAPHVQPWAVQPLAVLTPLFPYQTSSDCIGHRGLLIGVRSRAEQRA